MWHFLEQKGMAHRRGRVSCLVWESRWRGAGQADRKAHFQGCSSTHTERGLSCDALPPGVSGAGRSLPLTGCPSVRKGVR